MIRVTIVLLRIIWASPTTLVASIVALAGVPFGTRARFRSGAIECYGGLITWILERTPVSAAAMTLGHVIWGRSEASLDFCREHEHIHIRQYERWGPMFLPMYAYYSLMMWCKGKHPYYDNPFEMEAFGPNHPYYRQQIENRFPS
ncbi:hypothetical protein [Thalassoglobus neptunius]|nr:hypothetical protein [Thalassoglobus neptunius]